MAVLMLAGMLAGLLAGDASAVLVKHKRAIDETLLGTFIVWLQSRFSVPGG